MLTRVLVLFLQTKVVNLRFLDHICNSFSLQPCRGFNDAINGFSDDGWSVMSCEGSEDVIVAVNSAKNLFSTSNLSNSHSLVGGVLCAKASMLLQVSHNSQLYNHAYFEPYHEGTSQKISLH